MSKRKSKNNNWPFSYKGQKIRYIYMSDLTNRFLWDILPTKDNINYVIDLGKLLELGIIKDHKNHG